LRLVKVRWYRTYYALLHVERTDLSQETDQSTDP